MKNVKIWMSIFLFAFLLSACEAPIEDAPDVKEETVTVTFSGPMTPGVEPIEATPFSRIDLPEVALEGHTFEGWFLSEEAHERFREHDVIITNTALYARFIPIVEEAPIDDTLVVSFVNPFSNDIETQVVDPFSRLDLPQLSREGYVFEGWFLNAQGGDRFRSTDLIIEDTTLYAQFRLDLPDLPDLVREEERVIELIERIRQTVMGINNLDEEGPVSSGSGVIYKYEEGWYYLVTNDHVTRDYVELVLTYERNGLQFTIDYDDIEYLGGDPTTDIAILRFQSDIVFPVAEFADYFELRVGQTVFAIGSPLGGAPGSFVYLNSVTTGIVSGLSRFFQETLGLGAFSGFVIQHDAAINPGNSGGALFSSSGEFMGINTFKIDRSPSGRNLEGLGFAVPSNTIIRVARDLEEFGRVRRAFLGVQSAVHASTCGQDFGVCIMEVIEDSTAEALGLQAEDVIIGFKTESMSDYIETNNFERLREAILSARVGELVSVRIIRDGETIETDYAPVSQHPDDIE